MTINIKHPDLPFAVVGNKIRRPNGVEEPLSGDNLGLVNMFLLHQILGELQKGYQVQELPAQEIVTQIVAETK